MDGREQRIPTLELGREVSAVCREEVDVMHADGDPLQNPFSRWHRGGDFWDPARTKIQWRRTTFPAFTSCGELPVFPEVPFSGPVGIVGRAAHVDHGVRVRRREHERFALT